MFKKFKISALIAVISLSSSMMAYSVPAQAPVQPEIVQTPVYSQVNPIDLVNSPQNFLNSHVRIFGTFDKFSTLGLDYKPAFRSSKDYISFLIRRPDAANDIPLSELKLILKRDKAEKLADLETGDKIELTGKVFSTAMGDPWVDVEDVKILTPKKTKPVEKSIPTPQKTQPKKK